MSKPLAMLMIEDSAFDAELVLHEIGRGGFAPDWLRVETAPALRGALLARRWDVITCDWAMPALTAPEALDILRGAEVDCPVIIVSGEVAEEVAVTAMKNGAHDFVSKNNLARLVPAIERELREADDRRARRRVEGELRTLQQRLELAVEASNTGLWDWYPCTRETFFSARWKAQLGYEEHELPNVSASWRSRLHPDDRERVLAAIEQRIRRRDTTYEDEFRLLHRDGSYRWFVSRGRLIADADGKTYRMIGAQFDVSELKEAQSALAASERRYRSLVEASHDLIWSVDLEGRITFVSPAVRRLGHDPEELIGRPFVDFRAPEEGGQHRLALERVLAGETVLDYEVPVATGGGHAAVLSFNCAPLRNDVGEIVGATGTATDITDRKRMEEELRAGRARLQSYLDSADDIIVTIDTGQRITSVNRTGLEVSGYTSDELVGHRVCDFVIPELRLRVEGQIARAFAGERLGEIVVTALAKGDRRMTVRIRGGTVMEGRGPVELVLIARLDEG